MATQTPIHHPKQAAQTANQYPFRVTINTLKNEAIAVDLPCAYEPGTGGESGPLESEANVEDRIRIPLWVDAAKTKTVAVVSMGLAGVQRFNVLDVLPIGEGPNATILVVERRN